MILPPETNPGRTEFSERTGAGVTDRLWEIGDVVNVLEDWQNNTRYVTRPSPSSFHHRHRLLASRRLRDASAPGFKEERYVRVQRPKIRAHVHALGGRV